MEEPGTCGQGLAEHAALPATLGELMAAVAEILELHMVALDVQDESARQEHRAYLKLAQDHRTIAAQLKATGEAMVGCRDLPMGKHDEQAMASPQAAAAFKTFVQLEEELLALLQKRLELDRQMLAMMGAADER